MYAELESKIVEAVALARRQIPGYSGLIPLRFAPVDRSIVVRHAEESQRDSLCFRCAKPLFPFTVEQVRVEMRSREMERARARREGRAPDPDEPMGPRIVRKRNGPWAHQRCWPVGGEVLRWVPRTLLNEWIRKAGATYVAKPPTAKRPDGTLVEIEFCVEDLPPRLASMFAATNRGVMWTPDGTHTEAQRRAEASLPT